MSPTAPAATPVPTPPVTGESTATATASTTTTTVYALLVGIDAYPRPVPPLRGCVNDIRRVEALLRARVKESDATFQPVVLTNQQATRQAIIDHFRSHLGQAQEGDTVLFWYSGHGSQAPSPPEFWQLEPDRLDETLVCWDSRLPQPQSGRRHWDLADKELGQLIAEVAANGPHVTVVLDCCHSGSGTRKIDDPAVRVRRVATDDRTRPIEEFIVTPEQAAQLTTPANDAATGTRGLAGSADWFTLPQGRHVVLAACRSEEEAKELSLGGEQRGAFSYYLLDTLAQTGAITYRDLFQRVGALVRARVSRQAPQLEATDPRDLDQPFLGGTIQQHPSHFTLSRDKEEGWVINGGSVHGIPAPTGAETTALALFPFDAALDALKDLSRAVGMATVTKTLTVQSKVAITLHDGSTPSPDAVYKAVVTALPLPPLTVALSGDESALALIRSALATVNFGAPSLLVQESSAETATLHLRAEEDRYRIHRVGDAYPLGVDTEGFTTVGAQLTVQRLEHIARWFKVVELTNPAGRLPQDAVTVSLLRGGKDAPATDRIDTTQEVYLPYAFRDGRWREPALRIRLKNNSQQRLFCMLFDATERYAVMPFLPGAGVWLDPGEEAWVAGGNPIYPEVPRTLWEAGVTQSRDIYKLIVTVDESDAGLLTQKALPTVVVDGTTKAAPPSHMSTLNRLLYRVGSRDFRFFPEEEESFSDWYAIGIPVTVVRPKEAVQVAPVGSRAVLSTGVTLLGHPQLQATARLTTLPEATRDAGNRLTPPLLRDHPDLFAPLELSGSRSGLPGLSVLELNDVNDHTLVTPEAPLIVQLETGLQPGDGVLPIGFDGELYLPLGRVERTSTGLTVTLERLPAPTTAGTRDLKGAIKILFQKLVAQPLGFTYTYPQLAIAEISDDGETSYEKDVAAIRDRVAAAEKIVLYVHGIIGDTRVMSASSRTDWQAWPEPIPGAGEHYDLVLTFDYENLNTPIEENATLLKARLSEVGLGPGHGKTFHIIAHSMGGLISRWFIEREGGKLVVQKLIMLGTPNAGSPWPTVQDYANLALGIGLNALSQFSWPAGVISGLVGAIETVDVSLDQLRPDSQLLTQLNSSDDPGIPYVMIAGNTSIIPGALALDGESGTSLIGRLWNRIMPQNLLHTVTAPLFFGAPNDIAVTVESVHSVPHHREQSQVRIECACDHMMYFRTVAGLQALGKHL